MGDLLHALLLLSVVFVEAVASYSVDEFTYHGFRGTDVSLDGIAEISPDGLLSLTNSTTQGMGHAFYPIPLRFTNSTGGNISSFSTTFVFAIVSDRQDQAGHGLAFALSPTKGRPGSQPKAYLGLFNSTDNGQPWNHVVAVELDTVDSMEFEDKGDNHVGIDVYGLHSISSAPASYFSEETGVFKDLPLMSGEPMQIWIEYNGAEKRLNVTLHPTDVPKPGRPLLSSSAINLSSAILDTMYVGFSSSTGAVSTNHYILGWSFRMNGEARQLNLSRLPQLPRRGLHHNKLFGIKIASVVILFLAAVAAAVVFCARRKKFEDIFEEWEATYASHRFPYRELYKATKGFSDKQLLGVGGFGRVYKGSIPPNGVDVAVKKVSHESSQGMREFVAEIVSIGQMRHRNLVRLLGYCRREGELLLVYEFMPSGSLDKLLFDRPVSALSWSQRFRIVKGIAMALHYLHEGWEQVVIHRDVKASNVLLDGELNGLLGDFGLARLHDSGGDPCTTRVVGTLGYLAPEVAMTGKATTSADVFAFGALVLEIACGRRVVETHGPPDEASELVLVDWVSGCWERGDILEASDPMLGGDYVVEEMELTLKLGLLCSHPEPTARPSMRQVMEYLEEDAPLSEMSKDAIAVPAPTYEDDH